MLSNLSNIKNSAGNIYCCIDTDNNYSVISKQDIYKIFNLHTPFGLIYQSDQEGNYNLSNDDIFRYKWTLPKITNLWLKVDIKTVRNNFEIPIDSIEAIRSKLQANLDIHYKVGLDFTPEKYLEINKDIPFASEIKLWFAESPYWNFYEFLNYSYFIQLIQDLKDLYNNCYSSYSFAEIIYKQKKIKIADFVDLKTFKPILGSLIKVWQNGGIFNSYINFLKWIFGDQTNVNITIVAPACLNIKVKNYNSNYFARILENNKYLRNTEDKEFIRISSQVILEITTNEMLAYLQTFLPTCYYVYFEFNEEE